MLNSRFRQHHSVCRQIVQVHQSLNYSGHGSSILIHSYVAENDYVGVDCRLRNYGNHHRMCLMCLHISHNSCNWSRIGGKRHCNRCTHGLKSNQPNCVNRPFWQIDPANRRNFYLAADDLHCSPYQFGQECERIGLVTGLFLGDFSFV